MLQTLERAIARLLSWALFLLVVAISLAAATLALAVFLLAGLVTLIQSAASRLWNFSKGHRNV